MIPRLHVFSIRHSAGAFASVSAMGQRLNRALAQLGTICLVVGFIISAIGSEGAADYTFAAGLLFHLAAWFDNWWNAASQS